MFSRFYSKEPILILVISLIVIGSFVFAFNLNNRLFWDDEDWILNNTYVHDVSWENIKFWFSHNTLAGVGLKSNYYRPFLFFTFALNYATSQVNPLSYHLFSNFLHLVSGVLLFILLYRLFKSRALAFMVSLLFIVHPLQTEAITYIAGRGDALVAFFMLSALFLFYIAQSSTSLSNNKKRLLMTISVVLVMLGLLSRETGIVFPLIALLFYIIFISTKRLSGSIKEGLLKTWPYFIVVIFYGILRLTILNFLNTLNFYAEPNLYSENLHIRLLTFVPILWNYIKLLIVPIGLHMERSVVVYTSIFQWPVWIISLALIGLLVLLRYFYKKESLINKAAASTRISEFKLWLFGVLWFFITILPVSGITPVNALMYEHWLYLPMVGFWLIISFYLIKVFKYLRSRSLTVYYLLFTAVLVAYLSFFVYQSVQRNILWGNPEKFYKDILKYEPTSGRINNNLGNLYFNQKNVDRAEYYYRQAIENDDTFAQPYYNLGSIAQSKGNIYEAIQLYEKSVAINPNFFYSYQGLAVIYAQQGNFIKAIENMEKLKILLPTNPRVYYNSALIYVATKDRNKALEAATSGLRHGQSDPETAKLLQELIDKLSR